MTIFYLSNCARCGIEHRSVYNMSGTEITCYSCGKSTIDVNNRTVEVVDGVQQEAPPVDYANPFKGNYTKHPTAALVEERGESYGTPLKRFAACEEMFDEWEELALKDGSKFGDMTSDQQGAVAHGVHWIIDKLTRAANDPMKKDNWDDIQGYAQCIKDALELEEDNGAQI